ncbi:uncharacterized protein PHA67_011967 [Liasis olivaceus]
MLLLLLLISYLRHLQATRALPFHPGEKTTGPRRYRGESPPLPLNLFGGLLSTTYEGFRFRIEQLRAFGLELRRDGRGAVKRRKAATRRLLRAGTGRCRLSLSARASAGRGHRNSPFVGKGAATERALPWAVTSLFLRSLFLMQEL